MKRFIKDPLQYVGGYTLDVYCDHENPDHPFSPHHPGHVETFYGRNSAACKKAARQAGWRFHKEGTATCRICR